MFAAVLTGQNVEARAGKNLPLCQNLMFAGIFMSWLHLLLITTASTYVLRLQCIIFIQRIKTTINHLADIMHNREEEHYKLH